MKVFYSDKMLAAPRKRSPSPAKPKLVAQDWRQHGLKVDFVEPKPVSASLLETVHAPAYVRGVLNGTVENGFGDRQPDVIASVPYTVGALCDAALEAHRSGQHTAALCSGFHHASWDHGDDFCTFNGLVAAAMAFRKKHPRARVGILDCDYHYGNGTDNIIKELGLDWIRHVTVGKTHFMAYQAEEWLARELPALLDDFQDCDVVLYQAGADPYVKDPLGGWLTIEQLRERDRLVFSRLKVLGIPAAWVLAGGYAKDFSKVLEIHRNSALECLKVEK